MIPVGNIGQLDSMQGVMESCGLVICNFCASPIDLGLIVPKRGFDIAPTGICFYHDQNYVIGTRVEIADFDGGG